MHPELFGLTDEIKRKIIMTNKFPFLNPYDPELREAVGSVTTMLTEARRSDDCDCVKLMNRATHGADRRMLPFLAMVAAHAFINEKASDEEALRIFVGEALCGAVGKDHELDVQRLLNRKLAGLFAIEQSDVRALNEGGFIYIGDVVESMEEAFQAPSVSGKFRADFRQFMDHHRLGPNDIIGWVRPGSDPEGM